MKESTLPRRIFHGLVRWTLRLLALALIFVLCALLALFRHAIYNRYVHFPKEAAAWEELRKQRQDVTLDDGYMDVRGVCHSHSRFSHDSEMPFEKILEAAKKANIKFLFMSDHPRESKADFSWQWRGEHDGVYFFPGFEMNSGFLVWGLPQDTVVSDTLDPRLRGKFIDERGGMVFYAHSENLNWLWDLPQLRGMEIYNIHTDFLDEKYIEILPDMVLNTGKYPDETLREIFDRHDDILAHWDEMNKTRKIVGMCAVDAHKNVGVRLVCDSEGKLILRDTSPSLNNSQDVSWIPKWLLSPFVGPIEPGKTLWQRDFDPYERSLRYDNNHLLVKEVSEQSLPEALREGRNYVAFDMLCDATGFVFLAKAGDRQAVTGEAIPYAQGATLQVASPLPGKAILMRDGVKVGEAEGRTASFNADAPGKYRIEFDVKIMDQWLPWVYTNPINLYGETPPAPVQ